MRHRKHQIAPAALLITAALVAPAALAQGGPSAGLAYSEEDGAGGSFAEDSEEYGEPIAPQGEPDLDYFIEALAPHGDWILTAEHGWVWRPREMGDTWRPFTRGTWVYTEYGWTWSSRYAWGWAPFHYGNWTVLPTYGWCWVPGTVWSPGPVVWRYSDRYVGWAPAPIGYYPGAVVVWEWNPLADFVVWSFVVWTDFIFDWHHWHGHGHHHGHDHGHGCHDCCYHGRCLPPDHGRRAHDECAPPARGHSVAELTAGPPRDTVARLSRQKVPIIPTARLDGSSPPPDRPLGIAEGKLRIYRPAAATTPTPRVTDRSRVDAASTPAALTPSPKAGAASKTTAATPSRKARRPEAPIRVIPTGDLAKSKKAISLSKVLNSKEPPPDVWATPAESRRVKKSQRSSGSSKSYKPSRASKSYKPSRSSKSFKPSKNSRSYKPSKSSRSYKPSKSSRSYKPSKSSRSFKPSKSSRSYKPSKSSRSFKPSKSSRSYKPSKSSRSHKPSSSSSKKSSKSKKK